MKDSAAEECAAVQVGLFITCLTDTFYPRVGAAMVASLRHYGCRVRFPAEQTCCGQPAYNNGLKDEAAGLVEKLAGVFEPDRYVVSPSVSCNAMLKLHGPGLFPAGSEGRRKAEALAGKLFEFNTFVTDVLGVDLARFGGDTSGGRGTYHYSCHNRGLISFEEATERAEDLMGDRYRPLTRSDQCCGFGGAFATEFDPISGAMLEEKIGCILGADVDLLICDEAGCRMNIEGGLHRRGESIRVLHTAELIAEALSLHLPEVK